jgi:dTDP-4-dehydrorhamnose reductase
MKVLITGANGQLGRELVRQGQCAGFEVQRLDRQHLDITDENGIRQVFRHILPSVIINAAAYTDVDRAEDEADAAFAVNENAPRYLARCCADQHLSLIHISTDYVFNGAKGSPYTEDDPIAPLGVYGRSKARGEAAIRSVLKNHIIVRTSWLYGVYGNNFVKTILRLGRERSNIRVVADQFGSPTSATDLAAALLKIANKIETDKLIEWGTYHYCGQGITTWHGLAEKILQLAATYTSLKTNQVEAITTAEWPTPVKRPPYSVLDCTLLKRKFGIDSKPWPTSLAHTIERIFSENQK